MGDVKRLVNVNIQNHRISRKTVSFSISEPYDFTLSLLGKMRLELSDNPSLHADANWWSTKWCLIMNHLRTFYQGQAAASTAGDRGS